MLGDKVKMIDSSFYSIPFSFHYYKANVEYTVHEAEPSERKAPQRISGSPSLRI
jgi:hypothetical protein